MEKESTQEADRMTRVVDSNNDKKAITKVEMANAKINEIPREPVSINLSQIELVSYAFDSSDIVFTDFFPDFSDVYVDRSGQYEYI